MPRVARKSLGSSFFHVMVQGINKEYIFNKEAYMKEYIKIINEKKEKFDIQILAYCIMNNHAHLLIYSDKMEQMSEFMRCINTKYAIFYNSCENRVGYVFRNRFKSQIIDNEISLLRCIKYIHNNPVKADMVINPREYKYSSYNNYFQHECMYNNKLLNEIIDVDLIIQNHEENNLDDVFIDIKENNTKIIEFELYKFKIQNNISLNDMKKNKNLMYEFVENIREKYKFTYEEVLNEIGISKSTYKRLKKKREFKECPFWGHMIQFKERP